MKTYSGIDRLPTGRAAERITRGCLVLEGGGWKGLYTLGVLDRMMEKGINLSSVVGVSAGALSALGYVSGQIGWGAGIDLTFRHDRNYCGIGAFRRDHGVTGFSYLFQDILKQRPIDEARLNDPARRLAGWIYRKYPAFVRALGAANEEFNRTVDMLERKAAAGEIFLIAPSEPVKVSRFDGDMEKLGALYWLGYRDMERRQEELVRYLEN